MSLFVNQEVACIVQRATFSMLDLKGAPDTLPQHVGCAFDCWLSDQRNSRKGMVATEAVQIEVYETLRDKCGYRW